MDADRLRRSLSDRYEVKRELGRGGMASVFLAYDRKHGRDVAIKVLLHEVASLVGTERFRDEIRIAAQLQHPNILPLHDSGDIDGLPYYVMPYHEGESLRARLAREQQLPIDDALKITSDIAAGLAYAHARGIVHRDIKPDNIVFAGERAVILDFGIAHAVAEAGGRRLTDTGVSVGTPAYMSPEQASGTASIDGRSDLYSLGCVLYEMLAGEPPFSGPTPQAIVARQLAERPPSLQIVRTTIGSGVEQLVRRLLQKVPADRFATAGDVIEAIETVRAGARLPGPPPSVVGRPWAVALGGLGLVAAAIALWPRGGRSLDGQKIVVFPLADATHGALGAGIGEDLAWMVGSTLDRTEPLRWFYGWNWLSPPERSDPRLVTLDRQAAIARDRGARYHLSGSVRGSTDSATVILSLYDVRGDSVVAQASAAGPSQPGSIPRLGIRAVNKILPSIVGRAIDPMLLAVLEDRRPAAMASWLQAEREYRRAHFDAALAQIHRAIAADSAMAPAALRGAQVASWLNEFTDAETFIALALDDPSLLTPKQLELARGYRNYIHGAADSALAAVWRALALDNEWSDAWMLAGEIRLHLLVTEAIDSAELAVLPAPLTWPADSLAEAAFLEARRHGPDLTPPLVHLAELALRRGDADRAQSLIETFAREDPDTATYRRLRLMLECVRRGPAAVDWSGSGPRHFETALFAAYSLSAGGRYPECATSGYRAVLAADSATPSDRWGALLGLQNFLVATGRHAELEALVDSAITSGMGAAVGLYVIDAVAGAEFAHRAATVIADFGTDYAARSTPTLWLIATWASRGGRARVLHAVLNVLEARAASTGERLDRLVTDIVRAHLTLAAGDTASALARFADLSPTAPRRDLAWSLWEPLAFERIKLAELLLSRGHYQRAHRVAASLDGPQAIAYVLFLPASLSIRMRASAALGRSDLVDRYRRRLERLGRHDLSP